MKPSLMAILAFTFCLRAAAQQYTIDWHSVGVSGGQSAGGTYAVTGTVGLPFASALGEGHYSLESSFWIVMPPGVTPNAPALAVTLTNHIVLLTWPLAANGFALEQTDAIPCDLNAWAPIPASSYETTEVNFRVMLPVSSGCKYFRLRKL